VKYPKVCSCGASYSREEWAGLHTVGEQRFEWGEVQKLKNCTACSSTLAEVVVAGEKQDPAVGDIWKAKEGRQRVKIVEVDGRGVSFRSLRARSRGFASTADFFETFTPVRRGT